MTDAPLRACKTAVGTDWLGGYSSRE